jgi:hypothetical protein
MTEITPLVSSLTKTELLNVEYAIEVAAFPILMFFTRASFGTSMTLTVPSVLLVTKAKRSSAVNTMSWSPDPV